MSLAHYYLFNFAASPVGGGLKRLCEYARWFDDHGGAYFIIHPAVARLKDEFPVNRFFVLAQSSFLRMLGEFSGVRSIRDQIGQGCQLILTTGGTGVALRDVTPEAVREIAVRELPGFGEVMRLESMKITKNAILSRNLAAVVDHALVLCLPGKHYSN